MRRRSRLPALLAPASEGKCGTRDGAPRASGADSRVLIKAGVANPRALCLSPVQAASELTPSRTVFRVIPVLSR